MEKERSYVQGMNDLHENDTYKDAVALYGEWNRPSLDEAFEEAKKQLLDKLTKKVA